MSIVRSNAPIVDLTRDDLGITGKVLYQNTDYTGRRQHEEITDFAWRRFMSALSLFLDPIAEITRPETGEIRWTLLADPNKVPSAWLPVLAQWAGVRRWQSYTEAELRDVIANGGPGFWRGTRKGILAAVRKYLPPGAPVYIEERADGFAYKIRLFTFSFTEHDPELVQKALFHAKPAGLYPFEYDVRVGQTWHMLNMRKRNWAQVKEDYANWYEVLHDEPIGVET